MGTIVTEVRGSLPSTRDHDLGAGQRVGEYVIDAKLGEGGFGTVYRATHPLIGKVAAVKLLARQYSADPEMVSRFVAEARAVNQIRHRNIIDIFAFGHLEDGRHYYVMELLDGEPLDRYIAQTSGVSLGMAIPILRGIARALDAAHAKGIAHRDLKPENIFLARDEDGGVFPKLLDFGIAKLVGAAPSSETKHRTRTGAPIGTPYYMSPEQARGRADIDHRTDIYSFGCLAYELLTGKVPFDGEDHLSILFQQTSTEPIPPSERVALPTGIDDAIAWMMKKDPAERAPDLASAVNAIEEAAIAADIDFSAEPSRPSHRVLRASSKPTPSLTEMGTAPTMAHEIATPIETPPTMARESATSIEHEANRVAARGSAMPTARSRRVLWFALAGAGIAAAIGIAIVLTGGDDKPDVVERVIVQPAPAPSAPPAPTPPERATEVMQVVTIDVKGAPAGTQVFGPNGPLGPVPGPSGPFGPVPGPLQLVKGDTELQLTFVAEGYLTTTSRVKPNEDRELVIELQKKPIAATKKSTPTKKPSVKPSPQGSAAPTVDPYSRK